MNQALTSLLTVGIILAGTSLIDRSYRPKSVMSGKVTVLFPGQSTDREVLALERDEQQKLMALLNQGAINELSRIEGVSTVRGSDIKAARPFQKPEDVLAVPGIGKRTFRKIVAHVDTRFQ